MKTIRPIEAVPCCICGMEYDKRKCNELRPGRTVKYMCPECYARGIRQLDARLSSYYKPSKPTKISTR